MVNLIITQAPLLSGTLRDCAQIENLNNPEEVILDDSVCSGGGLAAVKALNRMYSSANNANSSTPSLVVPTGDFKAPLTEMSRFGFGVNVLIFGELGFRTWTLPAYTLWPGRLEEDALYHAQDPNFPAVISNVVTSPIEGPHPYIKSVHFDEETKLALIYLTKAELENTHSQVISSQRLLQFIYKRNQAHGCNLDDQPISYTIPRSGYSAFSSESFSDWFRSNPDPNRNVSFPISDDNVENCYIPVIVFDDKNKTQYDLFMESLRQPIQPDIADGAPTLRPHLLVDLYGHGLSEEGQAISISILNTTDDSSSAENNDGASANSSSPKTWLVSFVWNTTNYHQVEMSIASNQKRIEQVTVTSHDDITNLPPDAQTEEYYQDLDKLRQYAREALQSSLINEVGVATENMPEMTSAVDGFRRCYAGECELGNLFADAMRWTGQTDVALLPSFMFDGPGWRAGEIRTLELLENVPYAAPWCSLTLTGNSLLRVLQYSITTASFGPYDDEKTAGGLLQVSGLRFVYNNELDPDTGNILSLDVWDREKDAYLPINRTRLYTVASCNHLCFTFLDFPDYLGSFLVEEGEVPAVAYPDTDIKNEAQSYLLTNFYAKRETYRPQVEGRSQADFSRSNALFVHEAHKCEPGETFWDSIILECVPCPTYDRVRFSDTGAEMFGRAYSKGRIHHQVVLMNGENFAIQISPETLALPENIELILTSPTGKNSSSILAFNSSTPVLSNESIADASEEYFSDDPIAFSAAYTLEPRESIQLEIYFDPSKRNPGTDTSSVVFAVRELNRSGNCTDTFKLQYQIVAGLSLSTTSNHLGGVAAFGYAAAAIIVLASIFLASWVHYRRKTRVVSAMQPFFLVTICVGVSLIGSSLIAFSIDDGVASQRGCDIACMARPWTLSLGFTISVAALYSKLSRINKLFSSQQFRRVKVRERDVVLPTGILILVNVVFLLIWTFMDPLTWEREEVKNQPWNTYGKCSLGQGVAAKTMLSCIIVVCAVSFIMTVWQAFRARNISSEFSESKYLGIAVFSWVQLLLVGVPVLFLVDDDNVVAKYSLVVGLLIAGK